MFKDFFKTVGKIYFGTSFVLWLIMLILPLGASIFVFQIFSAKIVQHIPIGIIKNDRSELSRNIEMALNANPVLNVSLECLNRSECEQAIIRGSILAFIELPVDLERRALRLESPVIQVYSSGQNYLTNTTLGKEIRSVISTVGASIFTKNFKEPVHVELKSVGNAIGNYQGFLGIGLITTLFHMSSILIAAYIFTFPFRIRKVNEFLKVAKGNRAILFLASVLPLIFIQWISFVAVYAYAHRELAPMTLDELIMVSVGIFAMILACSGAGITFAGVTGNMRISTSVTAVVSAPAFAFVGQTFPIIAMPFAVRCIAFILPLTHILKIQSAMLISSAGKTLAWNSTITLLLMAVFWYSLGTLLIFARWKYSVKKEQNV